MPRSRRRRIGRIHKGKGKRKKKPTDAHDASTEAAPPASTLPATQPEYTAAAHGNGFIGLDESMTLEEMGLSVPPEAVGAALTDSATTSLPSPSSRLAPRGYKDDGYGDEQIDHENEQLDHDNMGASNLGMLYKKKATTGARKRKRAASRDRSSNANNNLNKHGNGEPRDSQTKAGAAKADAREEVIGKEQIRITIAVLYDRLGRPPKELWGGPDGTFAKILNMLNANENEISCFVMKRIFTSFLECAAQGKRYEGTDRPRSGRPKTIYKPPSFLAPHESVAFHSDDAHGAPLHHEDDPGHGDALLRSTSHA